MTLHLQSDGMKVRARRCQATHRTEYQPHHLIDHARIVPQLSPTENQKWDREKKTGRKKDPIIEAKRG
jgi:hypothetical protein